VPIRHRNRSERTPEFDMLKTMISATVLMASAIALPAMAGSRGDTILGAAIGAAAGAAVGDSIGGRDAAVFGGAIGGLVGAQIGSNSGNRRDYRYDTRHDDRYDGRYGGGYDRRDSRYDGYGRVYTTREVEYRRVEYRRPAPGYGYDRRHDDRPQHNRYCND